MRVTTTSRSSSCSTTSLSSAIKRLKQLGTTTTAVFIIISTTLLLLVGVANAALPNGFVVEQVATGMYEPVDLVMLPGGAVLVVQANGMITIVDPDAKTKENFMALRVQHDGEKGLLSCALDDEFPVQPYLYCYYSSGGKFKIGRFTYQHKKGGTTSRGDPNSEKILWTDKDGMKGPYHYGGQVTIGPDGCIWWASGDKFNGNSMNPGTNAGGLFRINKDGSFPAGNYGVGKKSVDSAMYGYGLRNGFKSSWDLPTGRYFIAEVGGNNQYTAQEDLHIIKMGQSGVNFGWPACEGSCNNPNFPQCSCAQHHNPQFTYAHQGYAACIIGGFVYRGKNFPSQYVGRYFFAEYARGRIDYLEMKSEESTAVTGQKFFHFAKNVIALKQGLEGFVYYSDLGGKVWRIMYHNGPTDDYSVAGGNGPRFETTTTLPPNMPPTVEHILVAESNPESLSRTFSLAAVDPEGEKLDWVWIFGDGTELPAGNESVSHTYEHPGVYSIYAIVSDGADVTSSNFVDITVGPRPEIEIQLPVPDSLFRARDIIDFAATATMADGSEVTLSWEVKLRHDNHFHSGTSIDGARGSMRVASTGHGWTGRTSYLATVTATSKWGTFSEAQVEVFPKKVNLTVASTVPGLTFTIDALHYQTPFTLDTLVGFEHTVVAYTKATCRKGNQEYFVGWEDTSRDTNAKQHVVMGENGDIVTAKYRRGFCARCSTDADCTNRAYCSIKDVCTVCEDCYKYEDAKSGKCPPHCLSYDPVFATFLSSSKQQKESECKRHSNCHDTHYCAKLGKRGTVCRPCGVCVDSLDSVTKTCPENCNQHPFYTTEPPELDLGGIDGFFEEYDHDKDEFGTDSDTITTTTSAAIVTAAATAATSTSTRSTSSRDFSTLSPNYIFFSKKDTATTPAAVTRVFDGKIMSMAFSGSMTFKGRRYGKPVRLSRDACLIACLEDKGCGAAYVYTEQYRSMCRFYSAKGSDYKVLNAATEAEGWLKVDADTPTSFSPLDGEVSVSKSWRRRRRRRQRRRRRRRNLPESAQ